MSSDFIIIAVAHDSTCEPGEEWLFPGITMPDDKEQADDDFNYFGCIMAIGFVVFLVGVAIWALT